jgi:predicted ATPase
MELLVKIENYKSIRQAEIELRPGLNILVGSNGSGKTCLLSALKFLQGVFRAGAAQSLAWQGGARRVYHRKQENMSFSFRCSYGDRIYRRRGIPTQLFWQIVITQAGTEQIATIVNEEIRIVGTYRGEPVTLFSLGISRPDNSKPVVHIGFCPPRDVGKDLFSSWKDKDHKNEQKAKLLEDTGRTLGRVCDRLTRESDRSCFPSLATFDNVFSEISLKFFFLNEYNILPDVARTPTEQLPFARMATDGAGVSEVIDALENKRYHKLDQWRYVELDEVFPYDDYYPAFYVPWRVRYRRIPFYRRGSREETYPAALENINRELSAAVKAIINVSVAIDQTNGRRFVTFGTTETTFFPEEVSDGTIKWLCILVSLFVPFSEVYLLEEPENFLHPWMQQRLVSIMREQSKQNNTVFLLSSHSATILNAAYPDEILIVRQTSHGTEISGMMNLDQIKMLLEESEFHLGDLWVSGLIGGVPGDE